MQSLKLNIIENLEVSNIKHKKLVIEWISQQKLCKYPKNISAQKIKFSIKDFSSNIC